MVEVRTFYPKGVFFTFYNKKTENGSKFKGKNNSLRKRQKNSIKITETSCIFLEFLRTQNVNGWEPRSRQVICSQKKKQREIL